MSDLIRILYVDDSAHDRELVRDALEKEHGGFAVTTVASRPEFEARLADGRYDLVLSDFNILGFKGLQVLDAVKTQHPEVPVILVTGTGSEEVAVEALKQGAADYVIKTPRHIQRLPHTILSALEHQRVATARQQAEEALRQSEARLRQVLDGLGPHMFVGLLDAHGVLLVANRPALEVGAIRAEEDLGQPLEDTYWLAYSDAVRQRVRAAIQRAAQGEPVRYDEQIRAAQGRLVWIDFSLQPLMDETGTVTFLVPSARDVTERKEAEEKLRESTEHLRALTEHLQIVREEERVRIARELHDELGQMLTAIKMDLSGLAGCLEAPATAQRPEQLLEKARATIALADTSIAAVRRLVSELRPAVLDQLDLVAALQWQTEEFRQRSGLDCEFACARNEISLDPDRSTVLFRIGQEALTNVSRHAKATRVRVHLEDEGKYLVLTVQDDGVGLDPQPTAGRRSFGLLGMRERAAQVGGTLTVQGTPGRGTTLTVRIPRKTTT